MLPKNEKSFMSKGTTSNLREPESMRLGRDTEKLVETMEHEKRESVYLDQQIALLQEELKSLKASKKLIFPAANNEDQMKNRCLVLEKRIELEVIHLNETKSQSQNLRNQVNNFRKDKKHYKRTLQNLREDIRGVRQTTEDKKLEYNNSLELQNKYKKQIQSLRSKSMVDKNKYSEKVSDFSLFIQEKIDIRKQIHKQIEDGILGQIKKQSDSVEMSKIQRNLKERWTLKVREKKKALDNYMRHLNILKDTFDQIKMATGIHSVAEIVTSIIKSEDQNYEVYSYVNYLNTEIDKVQATYQKALKEIEKLEKDPRFEAADQPDKLKVLTSRKKMKMQEYQEMFDLVQSLLPSLKKILSACTSSGLPLPAPSETYEDLETIEYDQIPVFLGYIEEYLRYAMVFVNNIEGTLGDKSNEKVSVNLKDLEIKDFFNENDFEDSRLPMSLLEFQQKTQSFLKTSK
jgi:DNA repair exonuclease SbcCD ATPase subunit